MWLLYSVVLVFFIKIGYTGYRFLLWKDKRMKKPNTETTTGCLQPGQRFWVEMVCDGKGQNGTVVVYPVPQNFNGNSDLIRFHYDAPVLINGEAFEFEVPDEYKWIVPGAEVSIIMSRELLLPLHFLNMVTLHFLNMVIGTVILQIHIGWWGVAILRRLKSLKWLRNPLL